MFDFFEIILVPNLIPIEDKLICGKLRHLNVYLLGELNGKNGRKVEF